MWSWIIIKVICSTFWFHLHTSIGYVSPWYHMFSQEFFVWLVAIPCNVLGVDIIYREVGKCELCWKCYYFYYRANFSNKENNIKMNERISPHPFLIRRPWNTCSIGFDFLEFFFDFLAETCSLIPNIVSDWKKSRIFPVQFCC